MSYDEIRGAVTTTTNGLHDLRDAICLNSGTLAKGSDLKYGDQTVDQVAAKIDEICTWLQRLQAAAQDRDQRMRAARDTL